MATCYEAAGVFQKAGIVASDAQWAESPLPKAIRNKTGTTPPGEAARVPEEVEREFRRDHRRTAEFTETSGYSRCPDGATRFIVAGNSRIQDAAIFTKSEQDEVFRRPFVQAPKPQFEHSKGLNQSESPTHHQSLEAQFATSTFCSGTTLKGVLLLGG